MIPTVLSIDDDQSSQILLRAYLKDEGFCSEFVSKSNGQEAIDYLVDLAYAATANAWPSVIFLDINMPVLDGWGFIEKIEPLCQQLDKHPIIVMVSATNTTEDIARVNNTPRVLNLALKPINGFVINQLKQHRNLRPFFDYKHSRAGGNYRPNSL